MSFPVDRSGAEPSAFNLLSSWTPFNELPGGIDEFSPRSAVAFKPAPVATAVDATLRVDAVGKAADDADSSDSDGRGAIATRTP